MESGYQLVSALFIRLLGIIYLVAFISIAPQIDGLAGSHGILPFHQQLEYFAGQHGIGRYLLMPNLFWLNDSDKALQAAAVAGCLVSILIILNYVQRFALVAAFVLYLSLYYAGQLFMNFQWDALLLEAGFLAIFLNPRSRIIILLFRWLLFRLRFMSGLSKLSLQDPTWSGLTALNTYFEVQPLPAPLAWYAQQLPEWILKVGTASTLVIELVVPFMMFLPRRFRFVAAWITILWQILILLTSNHNWFNILTIFLCLFLFDDKAVKKVIPNRLQNLLLKDTPAPSNNPVARIFPRVLAVFIVFVSAVQIVELATMKQSTGWIHSVVNLGETYRIVTKYHVFPTMKTERIELEISGSQDGTTWKTYEFRYKPQDPYTRPEFIVPHQPRLDWMMWFVTLHPMFMPWFDQFLHRLLENSPQVIALLKNNPFPDSPPRFIRVEAYRYRFTTFEERKKTGQWWHREALGPFTPLPWLQQWSPVNARPAP